MRSSRRATQSPYMRNINVQWGRLDLSSVWEMDFDDPGPQGIPSEAGDVSDFAKAVPASGRPRSGAAKSGNATSRSPYIASGQANTAVPEYIETSFGLS